MTLRDIRDFLWQHDVPDTAEIIMQAPADTESVEPRYVVDGGIEYDKEKNELIIVLE